MSIKNWNRMAVSILGSGLILAATAAHSEEEINFVSWGGAYTQSQLDGYLNDYMSETGTKINVIDYNGGVAQIRAQIEADNVVWDIVDIIPGDMIRACDEGLLEIINPEEWVAPSEDGSPVEEDFLDGAGYHECAIGNTVWSTVLAYDADRLTEAQPSGLADFWDTAKFPGKRGMRRVAEVNLEWALMVDGVPADQVYDVLGTPEGVDRAFKKLDEIKDDVIWWEAGAQAPQLLADGEVVMTTAYNGRLYNALKNEGKNFVLLWQTQIWDQGFMSIVKGAPNKDAALKLLAWYSNPERMANQTNYISYPPPRNSALKFVPDDVLPHLPTYPDNIAGTLKFDAEFWADNKDEYGERFAAWLAK